MKIVVNENKTIGTDVTFDRPNHRHKDADTPNVALRAESKAGICVASYIVVAALVFPVTFIVSLALGYGVVKSFLIAMVLAAPLTVTVVLVLRLLTRS